MCHDIVNNKADVFEIAYFSQFLDRLSPLFKEYPTFILDSFIECDKLRMAQNKCLESTGKIYRYLISQNNFEVEVVKNNPTYN